MDLATRQKLIDARTALLLSAIGPDVEATLSAVELRYLRWLADHDQETRDVFEGLFRRLRGAK